MVTNLKGKMVRKFEKDHWKTTKWKWKNKIYGKKLDLHL
jgi:hypothetical protein